MIFGMADALYKGAAGSGLCSMVFLQICRYKNGLLRSRRLG
jgi:hypothetical protein